MLGLVCYGRYCITLRQVTQANARSRKTDLILYFFRIKWYPANREEVIYIEVSINEFLNTAFASASTCCSMITLEKGELDMPGLNEIKNAVHAIAPKYGIERVYLFGSFARGDVNEDSDYDFRIVGGSFRSLYDLIAFRLDLEDTLGREVDVVQTKNMQDSFYNVIKDEEVLVFG